MMKWIKERPHSLWLLYYIPYAITFFLLERVIEPKYIIYSSLDDLIPFVSAFIYPYLSWFPFMFGFLIYFLIKDKESFVNLCFCMFTGMSISLLVYVIFPNGLDIRVIDTGTGITDRFVQMIQSVDNSNNVCPSIHVSSTLAIMLVILKSQALKEKRGIKSLSLLLGILIILSTMFLKQHSIIDVATGAILTTVLYGITLHSNWKEALSNTRFAFLVA